MSVDWGEYVPYVPAVAGRPNELSRADARRVFDHCMETKPARLEVLAELLRRNGVEPGTTDTGIQALNDWFVANIKPDPDHPGFLHPLWYSVAHDVALFLGDVLIERHPTLRWEFFTWGKKSVAYQWHVIMGYSTVDPKFRVNTDLARIVTGYGHLIIMSRGSLREPEIVEVRGVKIDVDAIAADHHNLDGQRDKFVKLLAVAARKA